MRNRREYRTVGEYPPNLAVGGAPSAESAPELPDWRVGQHDGFPQAPFSMCFTPEAFRTLLDTVGRKPAETGAKGWSLADVMGFEVVEFDVQGSAAADGAAYRPDTVWGEERRLFHSNHPRMRMWSGDIHSHSGGLGIPSPKCAQGSGDLGYVEEVFKMNEWMQWFMIPILTGTGSREVVIHPWICRRADPIELMTADIQVCPVAEFPQREYEPEWLKRVEQELSKPSTCSAVSGEIEVAHDRVDDDAPVTERHPAGCGRIILECSMPAAWSAVPARSDAGSGHSGFDIEVFMSCFPTALVVVESWRPGASFRLYLDDTLLFIVLPGHFPAEAPLVTVHLDGLGCAPVTHQWAGVGSAPGEVRLARLCKVLARQVRERMEATF